MHRIVGSVSEERRATGAAWRRSRALVATVALGFAGLALTPASSLAAREKPAPATADTASIESLIGPPSTRFT